MKVSVLIANYNNEKYLVESINSVRKQNYQNIEIIVHDDASSDNSIKKINKYKNIIIIKNKKRSNYGSYNQMNAYFRAFKKSNGEVIFFLDSDDLFKKNKIKTIINEFLKNRNISSVFDLPIYKYKNKLKIIKKKKKLSQIFGHIYHHKVVLQLKEKILKKFYTR